MRRKFLNQTGLAVIGIALATLLTLAFAADGRDDVVLRGRAAAQRPETGDAVCHDDEVTDPIVATIGTIVESEAQVSGGEEKVVAVATIVNLATPMLVDAAVSAMPAPLPASRHARHTSDRAPPAL